MALVLGGRDRLLMDCKKDAAGVEQCYVGDLDAGPTPCDAAPTGPPLFLPNMLARAPHPAWRSALSRGAFAA